MTLSRLGERGWLLQVESGGLEAQLRLLALAERLRRLPEVEAAVPGDGSLGVLLREPEQLHSWHDRLLEWHASQQVDERQSALHEIAVIYDGPDLHSVAERCGLGVQQLIEVQTSVEYRVWFIGFQPGFPYLHGLPQTLQLPRRPHPRSRVPAGALAIAGAFAAIYPFPSPGGWHLLGRTDVDLFRPDHPPHCLLQPGDRVRFVPGAS